MEKSVPKILYAVLAVLAAIVAFRFFFSGERIETGQELTEIALGGDSRENQEQAATRLETLAGKTPGTGPRNAVQPFLARLLTESDNPGVRAAAMRALASIWDYDCLPKMLDLVEDPVLQVRDTAAQSVARLIDVRFDASASPEARAKAAKGLREKWKRFQAETLKGWQHRLEEKDGKRQ